MSIKVKAINKWINKASDLYILGSLEFNKYYTSFRIFIVMSLIALTVLPKEETNTTYLRGKCSRTLSQLCAANRWVIEERQRTSYRQGCKEEQIHLNSDYILWEIACQSNSIAAIAHFIFLWIFVPVFFRFGMPTFLCAAVPVMPKLDVFSFHPNFLIIDSFLLYPFW